MTDNQNDKTKPINLGYSVADIYVICIALGFLVGIILGAVLDFIPLCLAISLIIGCIVGFILSKRKCRKWMFSAEWHAAASFRW